MATGYPFQVLECSFGASPNDAKSSFRKLAMACHPDRNPNDAAAEAQFKRIGWAYEILKDDQKYAQCKKQHGYFCDDSYMHNEFAVDPNPPADIALEDIPMSPPPEFMRQPKKTDAGYGEPEADNTHTWYEDMADLLARMSSKVAAMRERIKTFKDASSDWGIWDDQSNDIPNRMEPIFDERMALEAAYIDTVQKATNLYGAYHVFMRNKPETLRAIIQEQYDGLATRRQKMADKGQFTLQALFSAAMIFHDQTQRVGDTFDYPLSWLQGVHDQVTHYDVIPSETFMDEDLMRVIGGCLEYRVIMNGMMDGVFEGNTRVGYLREALDYDRLHQLKADFDSFDSAMYRGLAFYHRVYLEVDKMSFKHLQQTLDSLYYIGSVQKTSQMDDDQLHQLIHDNQSVITYATQQLEAMEDDFAQFEHELAQGLQKAMAGHKQPRYANENVVHPQQHFHYGGR